MRDEDFHFVYFSPYRIARSNESGWNSRGSPAFIKESKTA